MVEIAPSRIAAVHACRDGSELCPHLQAAIAFEHAAVPPYLTAMFSLQGEANALVRAILHGILIDKMQRMALLANVLNALGGRPMLAWAGFVPAWPAPLPLDTSGQLVGLRRFSPELVRRVLMRIAMPASRPDEPADGIRHTGVRPYYTAILRRVRELGDAAFVGDRARQFSDPVSFSEHDLFAVVDASSAVRALRVILEHREGPSPDPVGPHGEIAHYFRLKQILRGRRLVAAAPASGLAFRGEPVTFDAHAVLGIVEDGRAKDYASGSAVRANVDEFNFVYRAMLVGLQGTFDGRPERFEDALSCMYALSSIARTITAVEIDDGVFASPTFEWPDRS
jgi:hypothetical protein